MESFSYVKLDVLKIEPYKIPRKYPEKINHNYTYKF